MKTSTLKIEQLFEALDSRCVAKQIELDGFFRNIFATKGETICKIQMSLSQRSYTLKLINHLSLGYTKSRFDFYLVFKSVKAFVDSTSNKEKDVVRNTFVSFTRIPKWIKPKNVKGLKSDDKSRDNWGRTSLMMEILECDSDYINILKRAEKVK